MDEIRCPGCARLYRNLAEVADKGGKIYHLGLALKAECGRCGATWSVNRSWRKTREVQFEAKGNPLPGRRV